MRSRPHIVCKPLKMKPHKADVHTMTKTKVLQHLYIKIKQLEFSTIILGKKHAWKYAKTTPVLIFDFIGDKCINIHILYL